MNQDAATTSTSTDSVDVVTIAQNTTINLGKISELVKRNEGFVVCKKENVCHHAIFCCAVASYEKRKQMKVARISHINIHEVQKFTTLLSSWLLSFFLLALLLLSEL